MVNVKQRLLAIRAWVERGHSVPLRATIHHTTGGSYEFAKPITVTTPQAAGEAVKEWLEDVVVADKVAEDAEHREQLPPAPHRHRRRT